MTTTKVNLANTVEGILPVANGGTGTSTGAAPGGSTTQVQYNNAGVFAGSANLVWDNSNVRLGIGTSSPAQKLQVSGAGSQYTSIISTDSGNTGVLFGDASKVDEGYVLYANSDNTLRFGANNGTERMRIGADGNNTFVNYFCNGLVDASQIYTGFSSTSSFLAFGTKVSGTLAERMRIDSAGDVVIGTTTAGGARLQLQISKSNTATTAMTDNSTLSLANSGTGNGVFNCIKFAANQQDMFISSFNNNTQANRRIGFFVGSVAGNATTDEQVSIYGNGNFAFNSGYGSTAVAYGCRAWVKFAGGSGSINGSGNVSSVTRNNTGNYTVNFSTAMPDTNYAVTGATKNQDNTTTGSGNNVVIVCPISFATGSIGILTPATTTTLVDPFAVSVAIFR